MLTASPLGEINPHAPDLLRDLQTLRHAVDDVHGRGPAQGGGVSGHEADGAGAENGDAFARLETGEVEAVPAGGENVSEEGEVGFVVCAGGELEAVEVGVGDAEVLRLWVGGCWYR